MKAAGAGVAERQPDHAAARRATATASPRCGRSSSRASSRPSAWRWSANDFYVANADAVVRFPYEQGQTEITAPGTKLADLPGGPINHHWTKSLVASPDGSKLYVGVGSNSNVARTAWRPRSAAPPSSRSTAPPASRASSPPACATRSAWTGSPQSGALWTAVNERDELGDDLVPDYMTSVRDGGFYGWPYSYYGQHVDARVEPQRPDLVAKAHRPRLRAGRAHRLARPRLLRRRRVPARATAAAPSSASTAPGTAPSPSGYKVIFVPFRDGRPAGTPEDVLTGFLDENGDALGRPVGVAVDRPGRCSWPTTSATSSGG